MDILEIKRRFSDAVDNVVLVESQKQSKKQEITKKINQVLSEAKNALIESNESKEISDILLIEYWTYIYVLNGRQRVWEYDYMSFSRRIGELWESFMKVPFIYSENISIEQPLEYKDVRAKQRAKFLEELDKIPSSSQSKINTKKEFDDVLKVLDSQGIAINLDLHFKKKDIHYVIDFKAGFKSNEKGNTNRLLSVAAIYKDWLIDETYIPILLVRTTKGGNNYLEKLKKSPLWEVYQGKQTYDQVHKLTGFDLKQWKDQNLNWEKDLNQSFYSFLKTNDLAKYLEW